MTDIKDVQAYIYRDFEGSRDSAIRSLRKVIEAAQRELDAWAANPEYLPGTDFVSQYALDYAASVASMAATSSAYHAVTALVEQPTEG